MLVVGCGQPSGVGASESSEAAKGAPSESSIVRSESPAASPSTSPSSSPVKSEAATQPAAPGRLQIAAIDVDEQLIDLGLADDGAMEVPEDPGRAGWFTGGGRPGGPGPTVVAGHVDSTKGPAVFGGLGELDRGDEVVVDGEDGTRVTYRVDRITDYLKGAFPTEEVFGATADDQLRLITCSGEWDSVGSSYTDNKVVYATAVRR